MARMRYDMYRVDARPFVYGPRDWKYNLRRVKVSREIEPFLFDLTMIAANEISERAEENFLRTFYFNMMSDRDFENDNFDRLINFIADYIELRESRREIRDFDDDLRRSVEDAIGLHLVKQVADYRELSDELEDHGTPQQQRSVAQNVGILQRVLEDIEDLHRGQDRGDYRRGGRDDGRRGRDDGRRSYGRDRGRDDRDRGRDRDRYARDDRYSRDRSPRRDDEGLSGRDLGETATQPDFEETQTRQSQSRSAPLPRMSDHLRDDPDFHPVDNRRPISNEASRLVEERELGTKPTAFQAIGGTIPVLQPTKGQTEMDMMRHAAVYSTTGLKGVDLTEAVKKTLTLAAALKEERPKGDQIKGSVLMEEGLLLAPTLRELAKSVADKSVSLDIEVSGDNKDGIRRIHHIYGVSSNAVVGSVFLNEIQEGFSRVTRMDDLIEAMTTALQFVESNAPVDAAYASDIRSAVERIDAVMTQEFNVYCRDVLRISSTDAIPSFMEEYKNLLAAAHSSDRSECYDSLIAFSSQLAGNIAECFSSQLGVAAGVLEQAKLTEKMGLAFLPLSYLVTYVPFTMRELGYHIGSSVAIVGNEVTPFLSAALDISHLEDPEETAMALRVLVTRDHRIFRVYRYPNRRDVHVLVPVRD